MSRIDIGDALGGPSLESVLDKARARDVRVTYSSYVEGLGWMSASSDGDLQGSPLEGGKVTSIEADVISHASETGSIAFRVADKDGQWGPWAENSTWTKRFEAGKGLSALQVELQGDLKKSHTVLYRVRDGATWSAWRFDGQEARACGEDRIIDGFEIEVLARDELFEPDEGIYALTFSAGDSEAFNSSSTAVSYKTSGTRVMLKHSEPFGYRIQRISDGSYLNDQGGKLEWTSQPLNADTWILRGSEGLAMTSVRSSMNTQATRQSHTITLQSAQLNSYASHKYWDIGVKAIYQRPELATGCESVALTEALNYYGFDLKKTVIADDYMPLSNTDFVHSFLGNPRTYNGQAIMSPGLTRTANNFLQDRESALVAQNITGSPFKSLYTYLDAGVPVIMWATIDFARPGAEVREQEGYTLWANTHCVTLSGYDRTENKIIMADPLRGVVKRDADRVEEIYDLTGQQAVVIREDERSGNARR